MEDRFQLVDSQNLKLPGQCLICGYGGDTRNYIDFGIQIRRHGRAYFCSDCFKECVRSVHARIGIALSDNDHQLNADVSSDASKRDVPKRSVGRPKGSGTRVAKPNPK